MTQRCVISLIVNRLHAVRDFRLEGKIPVAIRVRGFVKLHGQTMSTSPRNKPDTRSPQVLAQERHS